LSTRIELAHQTCYQYDRAVQLSPHEIRLKPAPHCRTPIQSYALHIEPIAQSIHWQQDIFSNYIARCIFSQAVSALTITVKLIADLTAYNPFDFFIEPYALQYPFTYSDALIRDLIPYLHQEPAGLFMTQFLDQIQQPVEHTGSNRAMSTVDFLVRVNTQLHRDINYVQRMAPGVQSCEETLRARTGSCRDSSWLLVQLLRHSGIAARFVSGYLIQLKPDHTPLTGPTGPLSDSVDLHAWAEAYIPGAGWIGLDPTSGLLTAEGHIPLAATPSPRSAATVSGSTGLCASTLDVHMQVHRIA